MPNRKKDIPAPITNQIRNIAISLRRRDPSHDKPTWLQVEIKLKEWMEKEPIDEDDPKIKWIHNYDVPGKSSISARLDTSKGMVWPSFDIDDQWALGTSHNHDIPSNANGALATIWRFTIINSEGAGFTIREAQWVDRLRWINEAGGSDIGVITDEGLMYRNASVYAAHQRVAQGTSKSTQSTVLDSEMLLDDLQRKIARTGGLLPPIDREAMRWIDELAIYKPKLAAVYREQDAAIRGERPGLMAGVIPSRMIQAKIDEADPTGNAKRTYKSLFGQCYRLAAADERWAAKMPWHFLEATLPLPDGKPRVGLQFHPHDPALVELDKLVSLFALAIAEGLWAAYSYDQWQGFAPGKLVNEILDKFVLMAPKA